MLAQVKPTVLAQLPIRAVCASDRVEKARHDRLVKLVEQIMTLRRQQPAARTPQEQTALDRQISATDAQINHLVYNLYGLTENEIKIVEAASA